MRECVVVVVVVVVPFLLRTVFLRLRSNIPEGHRFRPYYTRGFINYAIN